MCLCVCSGGGTVVSFIKGMVIGEMGREENLTGCEKIKIYTFYSS